MKHKFIALLLCFLLLFSATVPTYATTTTLGTASMISSAQWATNAEILMTEALIKYGAMGAAVASTATVVVGSAVFAYCATRGIEFVVDNAPAMASTLGAYLINNLPTLDSELARYVTSTIYNLAESSTYYQTHNNVYTQGLMESVYTTLNSSIINNAISMNQGLVNQGVIPQDILAQMPIDMLSQYNALSETNKFVYASYTYEDSWVSYRMYSIPSAVTHLYYNTVNNTLHGYTDNGNEYFGALSSQFVYYNSTCPFEYANSWTVSTKETSNIFGVLVSSTTFNNSNYYSYGIPVVYGSSYSTAIPLVCDVPLNLNHEKALATPMVLTDPLVITTDTALDLGTGSQTINDSMTVPVPDGGILDWLAEIWAVITSILSALTNLPQAIAEFIVNLLSSFLNNIIEFVQGIFNGTISIIDLIKAIPEAIGAVISGILEALFIPSEDSINSLKVLLNEKLPIMLYLGDWSDGVANVIANPEDFTSKLSFTVDFGNAENTYFNWGNTSINMLNLKWYLKFKPMVDDIIVGIGWLIFLWNLYGQLPNIISAVGSGTYLQVRNDSILSQRIEGQRIKFKKEGDS